MGGSIAISGSNVPITLIEKSKFDTNFGESGGAINFYQGGGLYIDDSEFVMLDDFEDGRFKAEL